MSPSAMAPVREVIASTGSSAAGSRLTSMRLLLVGSGHSHLFVLEALARQPIAGLALCLVAPAPLALYSGMVPGVLNRQYPLRAAQIDVRRLVERAGGRFVAACATALDAAARAVVLDDGTRAPYDVVSFDVGSRSAPIAADADAPLVQVKPLAAAVAAIESAFAARAAPRVVVIGGGAAGCELALALARRGAAVTLCDRAAHPLRELGGRPSARIAAALDSAGVRWAGGREVARVAADGVQRADGTTIAADLVLAAGGAVGTDLFAAAGLEVDTRRFLRVDETLRTRTHPEIFAAGDCATPPAPTPKSGVYAVRQGPILAANLRATLRNERLRPFHPQHRALALLNTADGRALLCYAGLTAHGRWAWRLKDWIDRRFVARFDR